MPELLLRPKDDDDDGGLFDLCCVVISGGNRERAKVDGGISTLVAEARGIGNGMILNDALASLPTGRRFFRLSVSRSLAHDHRSFYPATCGTFIHRRMAMRLESEMRCSFVQRPGKNWAWWEKSWTWSTRNLSNRRLLLLLQLLPQQPRSESGRSQPVPSFRSSLPQERSLLVHLGWSKCTLVRIRHMHLKTAMEVTVPTS